MESRWNEADAAAQPELDGLLYASRQTGADPGLVLWGGGNTSVKREETDFRGRRVPVMRIKGSGSDLRTIQTKDFPGVRLDDVLPLAEREAMSDQDMVAYLAQTLMEPGSPRPSIETLLHAFLPARFIVHTHADAILALSNTGRGAALVRDALGQGAVCVPYQRPGFSLSREVGQAYAAAVRARAEWPAEGCIILEKHGLVTWGDTAREAYERTVAVVTQAEEFLRVRLREQVNSRPELALDAEARRRVYVAVAPVIRGLAGRTGADGSVAAGGQGLDVAPEGRVVLRFEDGEDVLAFLADPAVAELSRVGPATPDHLLSTRRRALYVPLSAGQPASDAAGSPGGCHPPHGGPSQGERREAAVVEGIEAVLETAWEVWTRDYVRYVRAGASSADSIGDTQPPAPAEVDARPRVVLLPGIGMVTLGKDPRAARVAADIYRHAMVVMRGAAAADRYVSLSEQECFDVEYWPLERYRLTLAPPERELARRVAVVTGAANGIGRAIARRLARDGACVVVSDVNAGGAQAVAAELNGEHGEGRAVAVETDVTEDGDVARLFDETVAAFGGVDVVVSNAGIAPFGLLDEMDIADWRRCLEVNATGHFLVTRAALRLFKRQGLGGNLIFITTKNVMAPGREFGAYSAAKSAQAQLARVAALEGGEAGVRVNMINPDAIFRGSTLWSPELRRARAEAHGTTEEGLEDYYRTRNLLGVPIYAEDVAEAAWWLATDRSRKTTGTVITVDGGVAAAFPR